MVTPTPPTLILYHADCPDGFGAAWAYWKKYGPDAQYVPFHYDQIEIPDLTGQDVVMVDVSASEERLMRMHAQARSFRLIDHHETAARRLSGLPFATFDLERSGAMLAWADAFGDEPAPPLLRMIETRDLHNWSEPHARECLFVLDSLPRDFWVWDTFHHRLVTHLDDVVEEGQPMAQQYDKFIDRLVAQATKTTLAGVPGFLVNAPHLFANDIGVRLCRHRPMAMSWYLAKDGQAHLSFRADKRRFSIIPLAEAFGGGGARGSGAARLSLSQIQQLHAGVDLLAADPVIAATMAKWLRHYHGEEVIGLPDEGASYAHCVECDCSD